ncbi:hypothetical protein [Streptomyces sp. CS090A]|nr:hypothetical protein [Streptomyces sp. CS090A]
MDPADILLFVLLAAWYTAWGFVSWAHYRTRRDGAAEARAWRNLLD